MKTVGDLRLALHCIAKSGIYSRIDPFDYEESIRPIVYELNVCLPALIRKTELTILEGLRSK